MPPSNESTPTPTAPSGSAYSSPPSSSAPGFSGSRWQSLVQLAALAATWDLCRIGKIAGTHALVAIAAIAAPALAAWVLARKVQP